MTTNILATLTFLLTTNVTEVPTDYESWQPIPCPEGRIGCAVYHSQGVNPQGKLVTTTVTKVAELNFEWPPGVRQKVAHNEVLSSETVHLRKEWQKVVDTPETKQQSLWHLLTNGVMAYTNATTIELTNSIWGGATNYLLGTETP